MVVHIVIVKTGPRIRLIICSSVKIIGHDNRQVC